MHGVLVVGNEDFHYTIYELTYLWSCIRILADLSSALGEMANITLSAPTAMPITTDVEGISEGNYSNWKSSINQFNDSVCISGLYQKWNRE